MRMINRMIEPDGGRITVGGRDVLAIDPVALRRSIGYVIQQVGLFPHWTIADNIATVPRLLGWQEVRIRSRVDELLALVGMDPGADRDRFPRELSGGQRQRDRRRARARRRSAGDADGRAVRRHRPDHPHAPAGRVPEDPARPAQDRRVRHPRHRRGDQHGRSHRDPDATARSSSTTRPKPSSRDRPTPLSRSSSAPTAR